MQMKEKTFLDMFKACKLPKYMLYFLQQNSFIFYNFERHQPQFSWEEPGYARSFYLNTAFFVLLWSFDDETLSTRAIFLHRAGEQTTFGEVKRLMHTHRSHIADPRMLALVSAHSIIEWTDAEIRGGV